MNQKIRLAFLLCISITHSIHATTPLFKNIIQSKSANSIKPQVQKQGSSLFYTDFSGTWVSSKCMGQTLTLTIENSLTDLFVNGQLMNIDMMT